MSLWGLASGIPGSDRLPGNHPSDRNHAGAKPHYHQRLTETYYILQCEPGAQIELDGQTFPVKPGMCIVIRPGCVHRGLGRMTILNFVLPKFDPTDEFPAEAEGGG